MTMPVAMPTRAQSVDGGPAAVSRRGTASTMAIACAHRALGVILVGDWIAEIGQHAVAHVAGDEPAQPRDILGDAAMIGLDHVAKVLGIEPRTDRGRTDHVAEHDSELAAFSGGSRAGSFWGISEVPHSPQNFGLPVPARRTAGSSFGPLTFLVQCKHGLAMPGTDARVKRRKLVVLAIRRGSAQRRRGPISSERPTSSDRPTASDRPTTSERPTTSDRAVTRRR